MLVLAAIAAAAAATVAVGTIWWAIFGDKARGRRRCPRCWHDLSRTPGLTCSECGHAARGEADLGRARRRWGVAVGTLVAVAVAAVWTQSILLNQGWPAYVPDMILVRLPALLPLDAQPNALLMEVTERLERGVLGPDEVLTLTEAVVAHAPMAGAAEDRTARVIAAIAVTSPEGLDASPGEPGSVSSRKQRERTAFNDARCKLLDRLPPWIEAVPLPRIPVGSPGQVAVRGTVWGSQAEWRVREVGSDRWLVGDSMSGMRRVPTGSILESHARPMDGSLRCELDTAVRRRTPDGHAWEAWRPGPQIRVDGPCEESALDGLEPVDGPELRSAAEQCFGGPIVVWDAEDHPVALRFNLNAFAAHGLGDVLVGIRAELVEGGTTRRRTRLWWAAGSRSGWLVEYQDLEALRRLRDDVKSAAARSPAMEVPVSVEGWTLRITAEPLTACRSLPAPPAMVTGRAWSGMLELPVRGFIEPADRARTTYWVLPDGKAHGEQLSVDGYPPSKQEHRKSR